MSEHRLPAPDDWYLRALRWEVDTAPAARVTAVARAAAARGELAPELAEVLAEADRRYPEATHPERYEVATIGPEPVDVDPDPETAELLARLVEAHAPGVPELEGAPARKGGRKRGRRAPLRVVEGGGGPGGGAGGGDGGEGDPGPDVPGPELPVRGQWRYSTGEHRRWPRGVYGREGGERAPWRLAAPLPYVLYRLAGRTGHAFVLAVTAEGPGVYVEGAALRDGTWAELLDLVLSDDDRVMRAASTAVRVVAADAPAPDPVPRWDGGRLVLPPVEALPPGYLAAAPDEGAAREAWAEVGELACRPGAENLALNLGAAYAAPYPAALGAEVRPVSFALVGVGAPRRGKTTNANAAAAWYGAPLRANPVLSETDIGAGEQLAQLGCLPWFRDEVHAAGWKRDQWQQHFMRSLNGAGRRRTSRTGSGHVRAAGHWWGVQFLTGNTDPTYGATDGQQARVILLGDPHQPDRATARRVTALLALGYGWPFRWQLADYPTPARFAELAATARPELAGELVGSPDTVADCLALCVAGAELAGELIGAPELRAAAVRAARRALDALAVEVAEAAVSFGDRLLDDVWAEVDAHPAWYPRLADYAGMRRGGRDDPLPARDVRGFWWETDGGRVVSLTRERWAELRAGADYSTRHALDELLDRGLLVADRGRRQYPVRLGDDMMRLHTFRRPPEPVEGAGPEGEGVEGDGPDPAPPAAEPLPLDVPASSPASAPQRPPEAPGAPAGGERPRDRSAGDTAPRWSSREPAATIVAVDGGRLAVLHPDAEGGRWEYRPAEVPGRLPRLLDAVAEVVPSGPVTVVIGRGDHARRGLTVAPPLSLTDRPAALDRLAAGLRRAGWHRPGHPEQSPYLMRYTRTARVGREGVVTVRPVAWLAEGEYPQLGAGDDPDAVTVAERLAEWRRWVGCDLDGSPATTGARLLRELIAYSSQRRNRPEWQPLSRRSWPTPSTWHQWRSPADPGEGASHVHAWDAVSCYLPATAQAIIAPAELRHREAPAFDAKLAGYWCIRVPEWPRADVPPPVLDVEPGREAWVTTAVVELYVELGTSPEVVEAWVAPRVQLAGQRRFAEHVRDVLGDPELPAELRPAVKLLYQTFHGKVRNVEQGVVGRPDWGYAILDHAWCTLLRKVYAGAGMLPLPSKAAGGNRRYTSAPVAPAEIREVDTVIYAGGADPVAPESFTVGEQLGAFRLKSTAPVETWRED